MPANPIYRVLFHNHGKVYEVHARHVSACDMPGFIEVGELIFGARSGVLVDPAEERLKSEFQGVKRTYIPVYAVVRVDQVEKEGPNTVRELGEGEKVTPFPLSGAGPQGKR